MDLPRWWDLWVRLEGVQLLRCWLGWGCGVCTLAPLGAGQLAVLSGLPPGCGVADGPGAAASAWGPACFCIEVAVRSDTFRDRLIAGLLVAGCFEGAALTGMACLGPGCIEQALTL
jgi:hypothetical protein